MSLAEPSRSANDGLRLTSQSHRPPSIATGPSSEVLRRLELTVTRRLDGLLQGDYRGLVPGHGTEAGETRPYAPGDDVRRIDWNVTARTVEPHIRQTIADRELETWVLADFSASLAFGTADCEKRDLALAAIAAVGFLTRSARGNRIGAVVLEGEKTDDHAGPHGSRPLPGRPAPRTAGGQGRPPRRLRPRHRAPAPLGGRRGAAA